MHKADNLTTICADVMKYGNLKFLEPSGPLQVCNGIALPFTDVSLLNTAQVQAMLRYFRFRGNVILRYEWNT